MIDVNVQAGVTSKADQAGPSRRFFFVHRIEKLVDEAEVSCDKLQHEPLNVYKLR